MHGSRLGDQIRANVNSHGDGGKINGLATAALLIASAQAPLGSTLIAVALPSISEGVEADLVLITSLLVTSYLVVNVVCQGPGGKVSDLLGHSRVLWAGILLYVLGAFIGLAAPGVSLLVVSRCVMALAGALVVPATLALLRLYVRPERRGRIFGLFGATMGLSAAAGPALGGEIVAMFGWRTIFLANVPFLALAAALLCVNPLPDVATASRRSFKDLGRAIDFAGIALLVLPLALLVFATKVDRGYAAVAIAGALVAGVVFIRWEMKAGEPVLDPRLFGFPAFAAGVGIIALQNFAMYGLLFALPQFFAVFRGSPPDAVGYMLFVMMIGMVIAAPIGGQLTDRLGARLAAMLGVMPLLAGALMICRLTAFQSPDDALLALLLFGIGMGLSSAPAQSASMAAIPPEQAGMAAGVSSTMRYLGGISTILVLGAVLGDDVSVNAERHEIMVMLFAGAIALSGLACLKLPGIRSADG